MAFSRSSGCGFLAGHAYWGGSSTSTQRPVASKSVLLLGVAGCAADGPQEVSYHLEWMSLYLRKGRGEPIGCALCVCALNPSWLEQMSSSTVYFSYQVNSICFLHWHTCCCRAHRTRSYHDCQGHSLVFPNSFHFVLLAFDDICSNLHPRRLQCLLCFRRSLKTLVPVLSHLLYHLMSYSS